MTVPAGGEIAIYQARTRTMERRIFVGLTEPQWTAQVSETFGAALSPTSLMYSDTMGGPPATLAGDLLIRGYGGPPFEWVASRRGWFPNDTTKAFKVEIVGDFPQTDPVYPQVWVVGSVEHQFGHEYESARVVQQGSAYVSGADIGKFFIHGGGAIDEVGQAYSAADQTLLVEWDPDAVGGPGAEKLTVKWNGVTIAESSDVPLLAAAPTYWQIGSIQPVKVNNAGTIVEGLGTPLAPATLMRVTSVTVSEDGNGYEAAAWPAWTSANVGGTTFDNATVGERVVIDGVTWAKLPNTYVETCDAGGPSRDDVPDLRLVLSNLQANGVDRFQTERWVGRPIIIDTRVLNDAGTATAWKRIGMYTVQGAELDGLHLALTGTNRVMARLDTPIAKSWSDEAPDASVAGDDDAVNTGFTFTQIFENVVDLCDSIAGGPLATTDVQIFGPPHLPRALDNPGVSMLQWYLSLADRLVQEVWVKHTTSGVGRYGQLRTNLWTFGAETSGWTFYGRGGASVSDIVPHGPKVVLTGRGPGQVFYRQDNPLTGDPTTTIAELPLQSTFPYGQSYPENGGWLEDSLSELSSAGVHPQIGWPDSTGTDVFGGIANFRYRQERATCRRVEFEVINHDWMEVGDEIAISDPDGRGLTTAETWVISSVHYRFSSENELVATIGAVTSSLRKATDVFA